MKILTKSIIALVLAVIVLPRTTAAQDGHELLKRVKNKLDGYKSVCAEFKQTFRWELADQVQVIEGRICVKDGKQFRIETTDQDIVSDGKTIWTVNKLNQQIIVKAAGQDPDEHPFLQNFIQNYINKYSVDEVSRQNDLTTLSLKAKSDQEFYPLIELTINKDYSVHKIVQIDINENRSTYEIVKLEENPRLGNSLFSAPDASGYEIIDMR